jgi:hypothetical protein
MPRPSLLPYDDVHKAAIAARVSEKLKEIR